MVKLFISSVHTHTRTQKGDVVTETLSPGLMCAHVYVLQQHNTSHLCSKELGRSSDHCNGVQLMTFDPKVCVIPPSV